MNRTPILGNLSSFGKLLFLLGVVLLMALVSALAGLALGALIFDVSLTQLADFISNPDGDTAIGFLKIYQIINQVGIFIIPVLFYTYFVTNNTQSYLAIDRKPKLISVLVGSLVIFAVLPFNGYLDELNRSMEFPGFMSGIEEWMKSKELQAKILTEAFLDGDTITGLLVNIIIVAVLPAIGEELLFRGVLIRLFDQMVKNIHIAVLISSVIFSAIHLQFYGFLPRLMLGMLLGYMFVFTRSLWVPIIVHFVNNAASAIVYFLYNNGTSKIPMEEFGASSNVVYVIGSLLITLWLMTVIYQKEDANRHSGRLRL